MTFPSLHVEPAGKATDGAGHDRHLTKPLGVDPGHLRVLGAPTLSSS
jgi:hypothetical protein